MVIRKSFSTKGEDKWDTVVDAKTWSYWCAKTKVLDMMEAASATDSDSALLILCRDDQQKPCLVCSKENMSRERLD